MAAKSQHTWLFGRGIDLGLLLAPVWLCWLACFALPEASLNAEVPLWVWVLFVLGIDVSHVWSTLHRTYLDKQEFGRYRQQLVLAPMLAFVVLLGLGSFSVDWFWRIMAYLALWHFMKQQIGFLQLYRARLGRWTRKLVFRDKWVMYVSMGWPVLYWHVMADRQFSWFVDGDFHLFGEQLFAQVSEVLPLLGTAGNVLYWLIMLGWAGEELYQTRGLPVAWGKILWMLTTAGNWWLGIVYFNSDLAFTLTNVVAHGIPYLVLVLYYVDRKATRQPVRKLGTVAHVSGMLLAVFLLAFGEEYLWDMLINREKQAVFAAWLAYPMEAVTNAKWHAVALAVLALPQVTHYIIDGFIWKAKLNPDLKPILIDREP